MNYNFLGIIPYEMLLIYSVGFFGATLVLLVIWYYKFYKSTKIRLEREVEVVCALNSSTDYLFIVGPDKKIIISNNELSKFLSLNKEFIRGKKINEIFPDNVAEHLDEIEDRVRCTEESLRFEMTIDAMTGESMVAEVLISSCQCYDTVLYILRDISEQNRVINALVKRDKLLYALTCGTQRILDTSQDFDQALGNVLEEFCHGAEVDAVIMAQSVAAESCGYNVGYDASFYRIYNFWSDSIELQGFKNQAFEIKSENIVFDTVLDQEKIVFIPTEQLVFLEGLSFTSSEIAGFYATSINCQGLNWGLLLLGCKEIKDKWDNETEDAIEITALQFGVLLERRRAEESINKTVTALKRSQNRLNLALDAAGAASFEYDLFLDKFDIDESFTEKLDYEPGWSISNLEEMKSLIHKSDFEKWHEKVSALLNGDLDFLKEDIRIRMGGGKYLWVTMIARTVLDNDIISGLNGVFQDIDDKIVNRSRLFNAEKMASIGELSTAIANNFNEVNCDVINSLNLLLESQKCLTTDDTNLIRCCISSIENSIDIASNLAALSPSHNKSYKLIDINALISDIIEMIRNDFNDSGIKIAYDLNPEIPDLLCCSNDIMHVVVNLVMNAKSSMLESSNKLLTIATTLDADCVIISILDTGTGIPKEKIDKIFTPFFTTKSKKEGGTGLGLSVSKLLINKYGGEIEVNSCDGQGSEFVVILPISLTDEAVEDIFPIDDDN